MTDVPTREAPTHEVARCDRDQSGDYIGGFWEEVTTSTKSETKIINFRDNTSIKYSAVPSKFIRTLPTHSRWEKNTQNGLYYVPNEFWCAVCTDLILVDCLAVTPTSIEDYEKMTKEYIEVFHLVVDKLL